MTHYTGADFYATFGGTPISGEQTDFTDNEEGGLAEATAGADTDATYVGTYKTGSATMVTLAVVGTTTIYDACVPLTAGTLIYGPEGTVAGKPKYTVDAIVTSRSRSLPFAGIAVYTIGFTFNSAKTDGTYP